MIERMNELAQDQMKEIDSTGFKRGFHAIPSMNRLHLHCISQDFDSPSLKNKKHWNSFTSSFFIPADEVIFRLKKDGKVQV